MSVNQDRRYNRSSLFEFLQHDGMLCGDSNENIQHTILNIKQEGQEALNRSPEYTDQKSNI